MTAFKAVAICVMTIVLLFLAGWLIYHAQFSGYALGLVGVVLAAYCYQQAYHG